MTASALWEFDYIVEGNAAHAQANTIFNMVEAMSHLSVVDRDLTTPPGSPNNGDVYIVGASATGDWSGQDGKYAIYYDGWIQNEAGNFPQPREGQQAYIEDEDILLMYDGTQWGIGICIGELCSPRSQRCYMSPLPVDLGSAFQNVSGTAYFVYVGRVLRRITPQYVEAHLVIAGAGAQTAECGIFSSTSPPNKSNLTLSKIESTGSMDSLTSSGMKRNSSAFSTVVDPGTYLWAGLRVAMATTQPQWIGRAGDFREGFIQRTAGASALTGAGPWSGTRPAISTSGLSPDLRVTLD